MVQLTFNKDFTKIVDELPNYWKEKSDIPSNVMDFINQISNSRILFDVINEKYYCSKCVNELDDNFYCKKCKTKYKENLNQKDLIELYDGIKEIKYLSDYCYYYVFDFDLDNIILYIIEEHIYYANPLVNKPFKTSEISINKAYLVKENCLTDLTNNSDIDFLDIDKNIEKYGIININNPLDESKNTYLYMNNLDLLKDTIYRYSLIWDTKKDLEENSFNVFHLTYYPLHLKEFEILVKNKLYTLAYNCENIKFNKNFKDTFKLDKSYLPFMQEYDLNFSEITLLSLFKKKDIDLIRKMEDYAGMLEYFSDLYKIDVVKLKKYFDSNNYPYEYFNEYFDYLISIDELGLNLKDKNVLYPKDLLAEHDRLYKELMVTTDKEVDEKINNLAKLLSINNYEDDKYIIFPAKSIDSLIDESRNQHNCVRNYCKKYSNNETQIYFMREKKNINKSFVTIEVKNRKIVQARTKFNELPDSDIEDILNKWQRTLIPIINE